MLQHLKNTKVKGLRFYKSHARNALKYDKNQHIDDIVDVCITLRDDMLSATKPDGSPKYSANTIIHRMHIFQRTANLAYEEWGFLTTPLGPKMKMPSKPKPRVRFLTINECFKLINVCTNNQIRNIFTLYVLTGIRHAELQRLQHGDIFNNRITIAGKNGKTRSFEISNEAAQAAKNINFPVEYTYNQLNHCFRTTLKKTNISNFKMHDFRHTFASWLAQSGAVTLHQLQQVLGHTTINQTLNYAHLLPKHLDGVATNLTIIPKINTV